MNKQSNQLNNLSQVYSDIICSSGIAQNVSDAYMQLRNDVSSLFSDVTELVKIVGKPAYNFTGSVQFKQLFAHEHPQLMFEALNAVIPNDFKPQGLLLLDPQNQPVHYIHKISLHNQIFFIDAFGIFEDLNLVKARYGRQSVTTVRFFNPADETDVFYSGYRSLQEESLSMIEDSIEQRGLSMSCMECFNYYIVKTVLGNMLQCNSVDTQLNSNLLNI